MNPPEVIPESQQTFHTRTDPHRHSKSLPDLILGGQDGIVNVLGVLLGVAAAGGGPGIVVAAGLATASAGAISMAAVAYTSALAAADVYRSERDREYRHVRQVPTLERAEVRAIYEGKGFKERCSSYCRDDYSGPRCLGRRDDERRAPPLPGQPPACAAVRARCRSPALVGALVPIAPFFFVGVHAAAAARWGGGSAALQRGCLQGETDHKPGPAIRSGAPGHRPRQRLRGVGNRERVRRNDGLTHRYAFPLRVLGLSPQRARR